MLRIAIDGPAGSGKSTIAKRLADLFNITYIDTGAMYRAVAWLALKFNLSDDKLLNKLADADIRLNRNSVIIIIDGKEYDVTDEIRLPDVTKLTGEIAANDKIREILVRMQKNMAETTSVIMDGRDIGTVVIPDAEVKVFLTADPAERAKRRYNELIQKGVSVDFDTVYKDLLERDYRDENREASPLKKAEDAIEIDTTNLTIEDVVDKICDIVRMRGF